jgi:hypothetical protein
LAPVVRTFGKIASLCQHDHPLWRDLYRDIVRVSHVEGGEGKNWAIVDNVALVERFLDRWGTVDHSASLLEGSLGRPEE